MPGPFICWCKPGYRQTCLIEAPQEKIFECCMFPGKDKQRSQINPPNTFSDKVEIKNILFGHMHQCLQYPEAIDCTLSHHQLPFSVVYSTSTGLSYKVDELKTLEIHCSFLGAIHTPISNAMKWREDSYFLSVKNKIDGVNILSLTDGRWLIQTRNWKSTKH